MCQCSRGNFETETDWGFVRRSAGELAFEPETLEIEGPTVTIGGPPSRFKIEVDFARDAISKGTTDPNKLTDLIFFKRHPELGGRKIKKGENKLAGEWNSILSGPVSQAIFLDWLGKHKVGTFKP
jgi:hypothetical protein